MKNSKEKLACLVFCFFVLVFANFNLFFAKMCYKKV